MILSAASAGELVSLLVQLADQAYLAIIAAIWYYVVYYGLSPNFAYPLGLGGNNQFMGFYRTLYSGIYIEAAGVLILSGSLLIVLMNSFGKKQAPTAFLYRAAFGLTFSLFSMQLCMFVIRFFLSVFLKIWDLQSVNWYSLFSIDNAAGQLKYASAGSPYFSVMEFLLLSVYFASTGSLLAVLEVRQALVVFLVLTLPLFSMFFIVRGLDELAIKFWKLFLELNALPFFILIILYTVHFFPGNFLLQAALLSLAASSPYMLVSASSVLSSKAAVLMHPQDFASLPLGTPAGLAGSSVKTVLSQGGAFSDKWGRAPSGKVSGGLDRPMGELLAKKELDADLSYRRFDTYEE